MLCDTMTSYKCEGEVMKRAPAAIITLISISVFVLLSSCATLGGPVSYLQDPEEIYIMEAGILRNEMEFADGTDMELSYEFDEPEYKVLIEKYGIDRIAGEGTEFQRALRLMSEFAPRLRHASNYDNHITMEALPLLEYCLDKPGNGINCRSKAQIFTEMCLALGIHARKVWIMPNSPYDSECHVVNEIWDSSLDKWVMLDITNNEYWIDENGTPLSVLEIRDKGALMEFCTPVYAWESTSNPQLLKRVHMADFIYIMKNMAYMEYLDGNGVGELGGIWLLFPGNLKTEYQKIITREAVEMSPLKDISD